MSTEQNLLSNKVIIPVVGVAAVAVFIWLGLSGGEEAPPEQPVLQVEAEQPVEDDDQNTIGKAWEWDNFSEGEPGAKPSEDSDTKGSGKKPIEFNYTAIHDELGKVKLDDSGNVVADADALQALNEAFAHGNLMLDDDTLQQLQDIIRKGLPGEAGEQAAKIVNDYHSYLKAKQDMDGLSGNAGANSGDFKSDYKELEALRSLYLGEDVARELFAEEEFQANYMMDAMAISMDQELSQDEKQSMRQDLDQQYSTPKVENWDDRYDVYQNEKQTIMDAAMSDQEKKSQLDALQKQHFTSSERADIGRRNISLVD